MNEVWLKYTGGDLRQGDVLEACAIAVVREDFSIESVEDEIGIETRRLIAVTQSCDLENNKAPYVALCPIHTLSELEAADNKFKKSGRWEEVRRGKIEGLYMLPSPTDPADNRGALVSDFRMIVSLPMGYLSRHASEQHSRSRLRSPFVEHFSQAFARFFMRVGLPSQIPRF